MSGARSYAAAPVMDRGSVGAYVVASSSSTVAAKLRERAVDPDAVR